MKIYAVNLVVDTKTNDIYDKVALNKFPIIVTCNTESDLKDILTDSNSENFIKEHIRSKRVYDTAEWRVRRILSDGDIRELVWKVPEVNKLEFDN